MGTIRSSIKDLVFRALDQGGLNRLLRRVHRDSLVVLNYHGVLDGDFSDAEKGIYENTVGTDEFRGHLEFITRHYHPVRASEVESWILGRRDLPQRACLLTFDDGLRNNLTHAAPLLKQYGVPAVLFVSTGYIGASRILWTQELYEMARRWPHPEFPRPAGAPFRRNSDGRLPASAISAWAKLQPATAVELWLNQLRNECSLPAELVSDGVYAFLNWDELADLPGYGFEIGSHTVNHWIVTRCTSEELKRELDDSKAEIERRLGVACTSFCYPNGGASDWSSEAAAAVRGAGYLSAFALPDRIQKRHPVNAYAIDRLTVPGSVSQLAFRARTSGSIQFLRGLMR